MPPPLSIAFGGFSRSQKFFFTSSFIFIEPVRSRSEILLPFAVVEEGPSAALGAYGASDFDAELRFCETQIGGLTFLAVRYSLMQAMVVDFSIAADSKRERTSVDGKGD